MGAAKRSLRLRVARSGLTEPLIQVVAVAAASVTGNLVADQVKDIVPFWVVLPLFLFGTVLATHSSYELARRRILRQFAANALTAENLHLPIAIPRRFPARLRGRQKLIAELDVAEPGEIVLLCGMGGVGKTAVAAAVAEHHEATGRPVYWVNCLDPGTVTASMLAVARAAGMPEDQAARLAAGGATLAFDAVWRYLNRKHDAGSWLLVFDNADSPAALAASGATVADLTGWLRSSRHGLVILTSRNRDPATWGTRVRVHELHPLSSADGALVLRDQAPDATTIDKDVVALSERLGNLPLALQIAGTHLARRTAQHLDAASYLAHLPTDANQALPQTLEITLRTLAGSGYPQAPQVLWLLSILHRRAIPLDFVRSLVHAPIWSAGIGRSVDTLDTVIAQLHAFNLITVERAAAGAVVELHPLIAEYYSAEGLRSRRGSRLLRTILWGIAEHFARDAVLTAAELRAVFVDVVFDLMGSNRRRSRVIRELASATTKLAITAANDGSIALAYHYLALAQIATATVPHDNPAFSQQDEARRDRPIYLPGEPPTPHATGPAWPAIWLAADRRYDEAIQFCDRILDFGRGTEDELLRVRRVRLDLILAQEGGHNIFDEYALICAEEEDQLIGTGSIDIDDRAYTLYLGRSIYSISTIHNAWISGSKNIPEAVRRRFNSIPTAHVHNYVPLYGRRRLQQAPVVARSDLANRVLQVQHDWLRVGGRRQLRRLEAVLRWQHAELSSAVDHANTMLSKDDAVARGRDDPCWAVAVGILTALNDHRAWTKVRYHGIDWIALLDDYDWSSAEIGAIKFMASLHAEAPLHAISLCLIFNIGYQSPHHRHIFDLLIQAMHACRGTTPRKAPIPTAAARARARVKAGPNMDLYHSAARYVLAIVDDDRLWTHVDSGISWRKILSIADQELSDSRQILLALGASLFNDGFTVSLNKAVHSLDDADFETAIHAMRILTGAAEW